MRPEHRARRQSLLFLLPSLNGGGAERVVLTILRHLDRGRFDLTLAVLDSRDAVYLAEVPPDIAYIELQRGRVRHSLPALLRLIWRRRPDTVFSVIGHLNLAMALLKPLLPGGVRLIARETNVLSEMLRTQDAGAVWRLGYRHLYRRFDRVICQSHAMRGELVERFGLPPAKAVVIHNPVDLERVRRLAQEQLPPDIRWRPESIHLVAAGRLVTEKGFDLLIEALALTGDSRIGLTLLGEGPLLGELQALARAKGVADRVQFAGFRVNPYPFFVRADALVMCSRFEPFPNVVLEALACGAGVIATPAPGGIFEILEGRPQCVLAEAVTAQSLAQAIAAFPFARTRGSSKPDLPEYSVGRICAEYADLFAQLRGAAA